MLTGSAGLDAAVEGAKRAIGDQISCRSAGPGSRCLLPAPGGRFGVGISFVEAAFDWSKASKIGAGD